MAANNINRVTLTGRLTRDPELRSTPSGAPVCALRLASNTSRRDAAGEWFEKPNFFDVTVFGTAAENCATYLRKGSPVAVDGRLEWREWEDAEGHRRQAVEVVAARVQFLGTREHGGDGDGEPALDDGTELEPAAVGAGDGEEEDIPF
jgi:single-strand DNA-binding protein